MEKPKLDPTEPLESAPAEVKEIILKVLKLEKERLHQNAPNLNSDITNVIKAVIQ